MEALPEGTVSLICSGQIVTGPLSVAKELVENSVDAGAGSVEVRLEDHGMSRVEVRDDGHGLDVADVPKMTAKHFTSKLKDFEDLESLATYGFRGEALAAICAVAKVRITTKTSAETAAGGVTVICNHNGEVDQISRVACQRGTTVTVTDLFRTLPARRSYLSKGNRAKEELKKIEHYLKSLAIFLPNLRLHLFHNSKPLFSKNRAENVTGCLQRVLDHQTQLARWTFEHLFAEKPFARLNVWLPSAGGATAAGLKPLADGRSTVGGAASTATPLLYLAVNSRPVMDKKVEKLVRKHLIGAKLPSAAVVISIDCSPKDVDVNLDPNKLTVLLRDETAIMNALDDMIGGHFNSQQHQPLMGANRECGGGAAELEQSRLDDSDVVVASPTVHGGATFDQTGLCDLPTKSSCSSGKTWNAIGGDGASKPLSGIWGKDNIAAAWSEGRVSGTGGDSLASGDSSAITTVTCRAQLSCMEPSSRIHPIESSVSKAATTDKVIETDFMSEFFGTENVAANRRLPALQENGSFPITGAADVVKMSSSANHESAETDSSFVLEGPWAENSTSSRTNNWAPEIKAKEKNIASAWAKGRLLAPGGGDSSGDPDTVMSPFTVFGGAGARLAETELPPNVLSKRKSSPSPMGATGDLQGNVTPLLGHDRRKKMARIEADQPLITSFTLDTDPFTPGPSCEKRTPLRTKPSSSGPGLKGNRRSKPGKVGNLTLENLAAPYGTPHLKPKGNAMRRTLAHVNVCFETIRRVSGAAGGNDSSSTSIASSVRSARLIGRLADSGPWICSMAGRLHVVNARGFQEMALFQRLMRNYALPSSELNYGAVNLLTHPGLKGRQELQDTLQSMFGSDGGDDDHITDPRISSNGLDVRRITLDAETGEQAVVLWSVSSRVADLGVKDLVEILCKVKDDPGVALEDCRPLRVKAYLSGEAMRLQVQSPPNLGKSDLTSLLCQATANMAEDEEYRSAWKSLRCLHGRPLLSKPLLEREAFA